MLLVGLVVAAVVSVALTGSGTIGAVAPGWSVVEECSPVVPGDSSGSVGSASLTVGRTATSRYVADNAAVLSSDAGDWYGTVGSVSERGLSSDVSVAGRLGFAVADRVMPPVWFDDDNDFLAYLYGSGTGQVAGVYGIAVDPTDGGILVGSYGLVGATDRYKVIKYTAAGVYVTEFGAMGSGNGQFGGAISVAVSPVDQAVWVGDGSNQRIQKFTTADGGLTYAYSTKVGANGSGNGQFGSTVAIVVAVDASGNVYATDRGNLRIQKFNSSASYQAQVSTGTALVGPYGLSISPTGVIWTTVLDSAVYTPAVLKSYNSSLTLQSTLTIPAPTGTILGIGNITFLADGTFWAHWFNATYLIRYNTSGTELTRWTPAYPAATDLNTNYNLAAGTAGVYVLFRSNVFQSTSNVYGGNYVTGFNYTTVTLSQAIQRYLKACDANLGGMTYSYDAASDPDVVFPGWSGNVWAKIKELCTAYNVEVVPVGSVITVRDIGSTTLTIGNNTPVRTGPSKGSGGRTVTVVAQNAVAGGGVMWDSATEGRTYSIGVGQTQVITLATNNHPTELAAPVPTDVLPIQPGQYYVVDSTGAAVSAATWLAGGGAITVAVGDSPGTIILTIKAPSTGSGPFYFATGTSSTSTGALSIVGPGVITTPQKVTVLTAATDVAQEVAVAINHPFVNTREQALNVGLAASAEASGPNVEIQFDMPVSSLAGYGLTIGSKVEYESSVYRVKTITWGNPSATITAQRHATIGEVDTAWSGQTVGTRDTFWDGYSSGDRRIQPLLTSR